MTLEEAKDKIAVKYERKNWAEVQKELDTNKIDRVDFEFMLTAATELYVNSNNPVRTKIEKILIERGINQLDLGSLVKEKTGKKLAPDHISKIVSGKVIDYYLRTAGYIAFALDVKLDDIIEDEILKPNQ